MDVEEFDSDRVVADNGQDDLHELLRRLEVERPGVREAREDMRQLHDLLDELILRRKECGLSQKDIADKVGVKQPTISQFETESSDPKISTLQRYARAVGTQLRFVVDPPVASWASHLGGQYATSGADLAWYLHSSEVIRVNRDLVNLSAHLAAAVNPVLRDLVATLAPYVPKNVQAPVLEPLTEPVADVAADQTASAVSEAADTNRAEFAMAA